ncbi:chymotrypsin inhibitor SCI-II-like [Drosophila mojavensis]|uniref:chymotrypsin inhibitor SCI-II-like n=1 Tax=Drosophila mojavensis TaxID=7230 RepID=UPI001CD17B58|nr:chymotrypsin inhibitor SCI-II-like [Drosophila mojavensis]
MKYAVLIYLLFPVLGIALTVKNPICAQRPADPGSALIGDPSCFTYISRWTYYNFANECKRFLYGGCKGNDNRFKSRKKCEAMCLV